MNGEKKKEIANKKIDFILFVKTKVTWTIIKPVSLDLYTHEIRDLSVIARNDVINLDLTEVLEYLAMLISA